MLSIFSCVCLSVCLLWRNVCLVLWPTFWLGCSFFWYWAAGAACVFWRLILCQLLHCYYSLRFWKSGSLFKGQPLFSSSQLSLQQAWWDNDARNPTFSEKSEISRVSISSLTSLEFLGIIHLNRGMFSAWKIGYAIYWAGQAYQCLSCP